MVAYQLGVDLGTTYTAAAVRRGVVVEVCTLGASNPVIPSVVAMRDDGSLVVGDLAVRRGQEDPTRVAREFKRRLGDPAPLVLGSTPFSAESLMAAVLRFVVELVAEREGDRPASVVLTHPANYGPYKLDMMREVARLAGLDLSTVTMITEPQAAAISYSARDRIAPGEHVAVYDFGGGTFDAAVLRKTVDGFELVGQPEGLERFGGIDIDAAILAHVDDQLDGALSSLDSTDRDVQVGLQRLREEVRAAKEALSGDSEAAVQVSLPSIHERVRITRGEIEQMVQPRLRDTTHAVERTVRSAGLAMEDISRILLVGGSSRIPLVSDLVARTMGRPVAVDAHPKLAIATGAASAEPRSAERAPELPVPPVVPIFDAPQQRAPAPPVASAATSPASRRRWIGAVAGLLAVVVVGVVIATRDDGGSEGATTSPTEERSTTDPATGSSTAATAVTAAGDPSPSDAAAIAVVDGLITGSGVSSSSTLVVLPRCPLDLVRLTDRIPALSKGFWVDAAEAGVVSVARFGSGSDPSTVRCTGGDPLAGTFSAVVVSTPIPDDLETYIRRDNSGSRAGDSVTSTVSVLVSAELDGVEVKRACVTETIDSTSGDGEAAWCEVVWLGPSMTVRLQGSSPMTIDLLEDWLQVSIEAILNDIATP